VRNPDHEPQLVESTRTPLHEPATVSAPCLCSDKAKSSPQWLGALAPYPAGWAARPLGLEVAQFGWPPVFLNKGKTPN
jgi:hypothetical protein